nr:MAG: SRPBCC family protein [Hyphomicrobiales bacterium]
MSEFGVFVSQNPAGDSIRFERTLGALPPRVWEYLTQSELLSEWLGSGEIDAEIGGKVFLRSGGPVIRGTVLACDPPSKLSYSWNVLMLGTEQPVTIEAILTYDLTERDGKTELVLAHGPVEAQFRGATAAGWHAILDILAAHVAEESPPDFMEVYQRVAPEYDKMFAG